MLNLLNIEKPIKVNGIVYPSSNAAWEKLKDTDGPFEILINFKEEKKVVEAPKPEVKEVPVFRVEVKQYMTKEASPGFDFMQKWNNNSPMPMRRMYGEVLEETKGMYRMRLHGRAEKDSTNCSHCLRELTHPVSVYYGVGPICGEHMHMAPMSVLEKIADKEELFRQADEKLRAVTWEGWIIKSAITNMTQIETKKEKVTA